MRITFERQTLPGYRVMLGRQEKTHVGSIRPGPSGQWMAYDLKGRWLGTGTTRKGAANYLRLGAAREVTV
jgi:hypothetical protein